MRKLSEKEEKFIADIIKLDTPAMVANLITDLTGNLLIKQPTNDQGTLEIFYETSSGIHTNQDAIDAINELYENLIIILNLLSTLESEGYIVLYNNAPKSPLTTIGSMDGNSDNISMKFPDQSFSKKLIETWDKTIIITPELKRFQKEGYISRDEQKFNAQRRLSIAALSVSIAALFLTTWFNLSKLNPPTKIDADQFNKIFGKLQEINDKSLSITNNYPSNILCDCIAPIKHRDDCKTKSAATK